MTPDYPALRALPLHSKLLEICAAVLSNEPQTFALAVLVSVIWQLGQRLSDDERAFLADYLHKAGDMVGQARSPILQ
jgi:hypothetical protein